MLLEAAKSSLLVIDIQERLLPAMASPQQVISNTAILLHAAHMLHLPVTVSEQYPRGLGHTAAGLQLPAEAYRFEKIHFSCWRERVIANHLIQLHEHGRPQVIIAGIEAHVCVLQTAIDMAAAGFGVFVVLDCLSSRKEFSVAVALDRMRSSGVQVITLEMALFELLGQAGTAEFKALSAIIK